MAEQLGVADAVHWFGVSRDVAPLYQLADAFVFPSSYEAFPLVALEAAASGLPVLATPVNGIRELVQDGANGFLISRQPRSIADRLNQLAADPQLRARLGRAARRAALDYSWERNGGQARRALLSVAVLVARPPRQARPSPRLICAVQNVGDERAHALLLDELVEHI